MFVSGKSPSTRPWTEPKNSDSAESRTLPHKRPDRHELKGAFRGVKKNFRNLADCPVTSGWVRRC